jgi:hypothetical protein
MTPERPELRHGARWRTTCIFCHNTVPTLSTLFDELYGDSAPVYQGSVSVELPKGRRFEFLVEDRALLNRELEQELLLLGAEAPAASHNPLLAAIEATRRRFDNQLDPRHGTGRRGSGRSGGRQSELRALPHGALHALPVYLGGPSARRRSGRQPHQLRRGARFLARRLLQPAFVHELPRSPRRRSADQARGARGRERQRALLALPRRARPPGAAERARASPGRLAGPGASCLNCHMPKKNMGLAYGLVRYHRIGSPTDRERVEGDRPLECALCHAEKSVEWTISAMERFWGKRYDRRALRMLYGADLGVGVIAATLSRGKPHERATAIGVAGEHELLPLIPLVVGELDNEYPLVRFFARAALERISGRPLAIDMHAPGAELVRAGKLWMEAESQP